MTNTAGLLRNFLITWAGNNEALLGDGSGLIDPVTGSLKTTATISGDVNADLFPPGRSLADKDSVGIFGSSDGGTTYLPVAVDANGHLIVDVEVSDEIIVKQSVHDDLNANANIQVGDTDVGPTNPVPVTQTDTPVAYDAVDDLWEHRQVEETLPTTGITELLTMDGSVKTGADADIAKQVTLKAREDNGSDIYVRLDGADPTGATDSSVFKAGSSVDLRIANTNMIRALGTASDVLEIIGG